MFIFKIYICPHSTRFNEQEIHNTQYFSFSKEEQHIRDITQKEGVTMPKTTQKRQTPSLLFLSITSLKELCQLSNRCI